MSAKAEICPPVIPAKRKSYLKMVLLMGGGLAAAATLFFFDPEQYGFYPICYLHAVTGFSCPGCGATRAMYQLLHGNIVAAAHFNLLFVLCLPQSAWLTVRHGVRRMLGRPGYFSIKPFWIWSIFALTVVFTVVRNLPGFEWLSPAS